MDNQTATTLTTIKKIYDIDPSLLTEKHHLFIAEMFFKNSDSLISEAIAFPNGTSTSSDQLNTVTFQPVVKGIPHTDATTGLTVLIAGKMSLSDPSIYIPITWTNPSTGLVTYLSLTSVDSEGNIIFVTDPATGVSVPLEFVGASGKKKEHCEIDPDALTMKEFKNWLILHGGGKHVGWMHQISAWDHRKIPEIAEFIVTTLHQFKRTEVALKVLKLFTQNQRHD